MCVHGTCTLYIPDTSTEFIVLHLLLLNLDPFVAFRFPSIHALVDTCKVFLLVFRVMAAG